MRYQYTPSPAIPEYQKALIEERMEHLRWLRDYPEVAALFEERAE